MEIETTDRKSRFSLRANHFFSGNRQHKIRCDTQFALSLSPLFIPTNPKKNIATAARADAALNEYFDISNQPFVRNSSSTTGFIVVFPLLRRIFHLYYFRNFLKCLFNRKIYISSFFYT